MTESHRQEWDRMIDAARRDVAEGKPGCRDDKLLLAVDAELEALRVRMDHLEQAGRRMLSNFSPFPSEDTERWREAHEACEWMRAALGED